MGVKSQQDFVALNLVNNQLDSDTIKVSQKKGQVKMANDFKA